MNLKEASGLSAQDSLAVNLGTLTNSSQTNAARLGALRQLMAPNRIKGAFNEADMKNELPRLLSLALDNRHDDRLAAQLCGELISACVGLGVSQVYWLNGAKRVVQDSCLDPVVRRTAALVMAKASPVEACEFLIGLFENWQESHNFDDDGIMRFLPQLKVALGALEDSEQQATFVERIEELIKVTHINDGRETEFLDGLRELVV